MRTEVEFVAARTARAKLVDGVLRVRMPRDWPVDYREKTIAKFVRWASKHEALASDLPPLSDWDGVEWTEAAFETYVRSLNELTLNVRVARVRIGRAKKSRLAQVNTVTGVFTFSRYAINGMPERALRYLVLHELAHMLEANHSPRFWAHVAAHEPDWKRQRAIAQAHHARMALALDDLVKAPPPSPPPPVAADAHPFGPLFAFVPPVG